MNLESLRRFVRWLEKIAAAVTQLAGEMKDELSKTEDDPLALHIRDARAKYRRTSASDNHKDQKATRRELEQSFSQARKLHYLGSYDTWAMLMRSGHPSEVVIPSTPWRPGD